MSETASWSRIAERGSTVGLRLVLACYRLFGRPVSLVLVHAIVLYYYVTMPRARRASRAYLRRVAARPAGAAALGRAPGAFASFLHFRAFALSIFDRIVLWFGREGDLDFETIGVDACQRLLRPDRGAVVVGAHLGSFDALRALARRDGFAVNVLMYTGNAARINGLLRRLSPDATLRVVEASASAFDTALRIRELVERGEIVAMLGDRVEPGDRDRCRRLEFLGDPVRVPEAPYLLAGLLECPLVFMVALRSGPGRYRVVSEVLAERVELPRSERDGRIGELAAAYVARLEHHSERAPYQWFNFFDYWGDEPRGADA